jgi:uncharacterized damage-inducible protein DinB
MNFYGPKELGASFRTVRNNTIAVAKDIPEDKYGFQPAPGSRTIAQTLLHVNFAPSLALQIHRVERRNTLDGFDFPSFMVKAQAAEQATHSKAEIVDMLQTGGDDLASWLEGVSDDFLAEIVTFPAGMQPPSKTRFEMLLGLKEHEMHHRGQLMMMERMVGVVPHLTRQMQERIAAMQAQAASKGA